MIHTFALAILAQSAAIPAEQYQPLKIGNSWTYRLKDGARTSEYVHKISGIKKTDGRSAFLMEVVVKGKPISSALLYWSLDGLRQSESGTVKMTPPPIEFRLPPKLGSKWTWSGTATISGMDCPAKADCSISGTGKVTVPAGTFLCLVVTKKVHMMVQGKPYYFVLTECYSQGVGLVKTTNSSPERKSVAELMTYKLVK
jgi:hypothetical protein